MSELPESSLSVRFSLLGRTETRFKSWHIDSAYLVSTDGFSFDLLPASREDGRLLELQPCELIVGGASQVLGRVDKTRTGHDGSVVSCEGRDYLSDLVECNVDPLCKIDAKTQLGDAILKACGPCGITDITDFENVLMAEVRSGKPIKRKKRTRRKRPMQEYSPKPGEGIYEFINRFVARHEATIQPGRERTELVIDSPDYTQTPLYDLTRTDDPTASGGNNIIKGEAERDYSKFPTYTLFAGTGGAPGTATAGLKPALFKMLELAEAFNSEMGEILRRSRGMVGDRVVPGDAGFPALLYRLLYHRDTEARTADDLQSGARRAIVDRLKDTLAYTCTVKGHADLKTGALYSVNTMANVNDAVAGVHEPLWIAKRTLHYTPSEGATTELELWRPESFQIGSEDTSGS